MEIGQFTWSRQTVLSERDGSEEQIFLTQNSFGGSLEPYTPMDYFMSIRIGRVTLQTRMFAVRRWRCSVKLICLKVTRPVLRISQFEGRCAMTNADEANEVQENVVTAKKGKSEA